MRNLVPFLAATFLIIPTLVQAQVQAQAQPLDSVLLNAAAAGHRNVVKQFLDSGANIETKNEVGATLLIFASVKGHSEVVALLLERGANVNAMTTTGITPLIAAAAGGHEDIVKLLLAKGAYVSAKDQQGRTALDMAEAAGETEVSAVLKSAEKSPSTSPFPIASPIDASSVPVPRATSQPRTETIRAADSPGGLTVRAEPSPQGQTIAYLPVGSTVTYSGEASNGWIRLSGPIAGGWIDQGYLGSHSPEATVVSVDNPEQCLRVRIGPGTNHEKIGCLPKGAKLKLTGTVQSGWAQIAEPMAGWVTARQIQAPGLFPAKPATSEAARRGASPSYRRQQSDSEPDFEQAEEQFHEEIDQLRRENEEAQAVTPSAPPALGGGGIRIGPFGIGFGR